MGLSSSYLTAEKYLEIERAAEFKSEYFDGGMFERPVDTYAHASLIGILIGELYAALRNGKCAVASSDLRVRASVGGLHTYPDISVVCGQPRFADDQKDTLLNPVLILEVLSKSTEAKDRGLKFREYRKIESLQEYVLVSQDSPLVEVFRRSEQGDWNLREFSGLDEVCHFTSIDCKIAMADIYLDVALEPIQQ